MRDRQCMTKAVISNRAASHMTRSRIDPVRSLTWFTGHGVRPRRTLWNASFGGSDAEDPHHRTSEPLFTSCATTSRCEVIGKPYMTLSVSAILCGRLRS